MERGNQSIPINPPNKAIERKLRAVHGSCLRKPRARPSIPLIAGVKNSTSRVIPQSYTTFGRPQSPHFPQGQIKPPHLHSFIPAACAALCRLCMYGVSPLSLDSLGHSTGLQISLMSLCNLLDNLKCFFKAHVLLAHNIISSAGSVISLTSFCIARLLFVISSFLSPSRSAKSEPIKIQPVVSAG